MLDDANCYKDLIENLYDDIYFVDRNRCVSYWNKGAEFITGYFAAQVVGRRCRDNILNHVTENGRELCSTHRPLAAMRMIVKDVKRMLIFIMLMGIESQF
jgi:PAS domain S-box-containing protein